MVGQFVSLKGILVFHLGQLIHLNIGYVWAAVAGGTENQ